MQARALPVNFTGPGLVDLQLNGYGGVDFNSDPADWTAEQFHHVRAMLKRRGVASALITFITDDVQATLARARKYNELISTDGELASCFVGLHIEGPFISPVEGARGAHPKCYCKLPAALPELIDQINEASGHRVKVLTLAPELPGAMDMIRRSSEAGIVVALGHTAAGSETITEAVQAGAKFSTHLGNGSHQMLPRLNNYIFAQLAEDCLSATFIADTHHVPMTTLKSFIRAKTPHRCILITDAMAAADMGPGEYQFGGEVAIVQENGYVSRPGEKNLAGSAITLDRCVINTFKYCDVSFDQAWAMASTQPAQLIGLEIPETVTVSISDDGFAAE